MARSAVAGDHPCEAEVQSACPDRPAAEIAACLKDPAEHESKTTISSECTDFIALNKACAAEISQHCDDQFFTRDTVLCLTTWTDQSALSSKCSGVISWAVPKKEDDDGPTDELGLSAKDYEEKRKWQQERKERRGAAVEKLREEQEDLKATERLDGETEEDYKYRMKELKELQKSREEQKKRERLLKAQQERERRKASGLPEVEDVDEEKKARTSRKSRETKAPERPWLMYGLGGLFVLYVFMNIMNFVGAGKDDDKKKKKSKDDDKDD